MHTPLFGRADSLGLPTFEIPPPSENPPKRPRIEATPEPETKERRWEAEQGNCSFNADNFSAEKVCSDHEFASPVREYIHGAQPFDPYTPTQLVDQHTPGLFCDETLQSSQCGTPDEEESKKRVFSDLVDEIKHYAYEIRQAELEEIALDTKEAKLLEELKQVRADRLVVRKRRADDDNELTRLLRER